MLAFLFGVAVIGSLSPPWGDDLDLKTIVEAHTNSLGLIHSIDITGDFIIDPTPGEPPPKFPFTYSWRWAREGDRERLRCKIDYFGTDNLGRPLGLGDLYREGREQKVLMNWDPIKPQKITPLRQGTVNATIEPRSPVVASPFTDPRTTLGHNVQLNDKDFPQTVADFVRLSPSATLRGRVPYGDHQVWLIRAEAPGGNPKNYLDLFFDPTVNFALRKVVAHNGDYENHGTRMTFESVQDSMDYDDRGNGIFVPKKVELRSADLDGKNFRRVVATVKVKSLNEPLSADAFDFQFPKHATVRHMPPKGNRVDVTVWGDGKPALEVKTDEQLFAYARENGFEDDEVGSRFYYYLAAIPLVALASAAAWWVKKRRQS